MTGRGKNNPLAAIATIVLLSLVFSMQALGAFGVLLLFLILVILSMSALVYFVTKRQGQRVGGQQPPRPPAYTGTARHDPKDCEVPHNSMYTKEEERHMHAAKSRGRQALADEYAYRLDELEGLLDAGIIDREEFEDRVRGLGIEFSVTRAGRLR